MKDDNVDNDSDQFKISSTFLKVEPGHDPREAIEEAFGEDVRDISEAPPEIQAMLRGLLESGAIEIPDEVLADMKEAGLTKDDIINGMLGALSIKH